MSEIKIALTLGGHPSAANAKELADLIGTGVMEVRNQWSAGKPVLVLDLYSSDPLEANFRTLSAVDQWAQSKSLPIKFYGIDEEIDDTNQGIDALEISREDAFDQVNGILARLRATGIFGPNG